MFHFHFSSSPHKLKKLGSRISSCWERRGNDNSMRTTKISNVELNWGSQDSSKTPLLLRLRNYGKCSLSELEGAT